MTEKKYVLLDTDIGDDIDDDILGDLEQEIFDAR